MAALCFGLLSLTAWSSPVPEEALVAYYPLNEGAGYWARDLSGNGNDGKIMGAQWTKLGKRFALQFDGMDDHIFCGSPAALDIRGPFTLSVWVLPEEVPTGEVGIAGKQFNSYLVTYYKTQRIYTYIGEATNNVESHSYLAVGTWNHIVSTFDGEKMSLFLNGRLVGQRLPKYNKYRSTPAGKNFVIGCVAGGVEPDDPNYTQSGFFKGMIADVKVYARALSGEEIQEQFVSVGKPRFKGGQADVRPVGAVETISGNELRLDADQEQPRKLEKAERIEVVRGDGFFPILIQLTDGTLAAVVRGGARHVGVGGRLDLVTSGDGGRNWSAPRPIVYMPPDSRSGAFGQAPDGRLIYAFSVTGPYRGGQLVFETHRYTLWVTTSEDSGDSWTPPQQISTAPYPYAMPYGKIVALSDGTLLMALYGWYQPEREGGELPPEKRDKWMAAVCRSEDHGATWSLPIPIVGYIPGRRRNTSYNEVALVVLPGGKVLAAMRGGPQNGLDQCVSSDGGRTWGPIESIIPGQQRLPADVILLKSGRLLLTFGHRESPFGVEAVLSHKEAQWDQLADAPPIPRPAVPSRKAGQWDWQTHVSLEWNAASADCGYPSSVQIDDGTIVTLYYVVGEIDKPDDISERGHGLMEYARCVRYREADLAVTTVRPVGSK